jgi:hypothetical protein
MRIFLTAILIAFISFSGLAQTSSADPVDIQGWYGVGLGLDLKKKWTLGVDYQARFQNNLASYKGSYISLSASKGINKRVDLLAEYRLGLVQDAIFHRYSFGVQYEPKVSGVDLDFRLLILNNIQDFMDVTSATQNALFWRSRIKLGMKLNKEWQLYLATEPVMKVGGVRFVDNWRNTIGVKRKVSSSAKLDLFYMYRPDYAKASYSRLFHVVGLNLDFATTLSKKKKKK